MTKEVIYVELSVKSSNKNIEITNESQIGENIVTTNTPTLMYDAMGTVVMLCDPQNPLKANEEIIMYTLCSLKSYSPENEAILWETIHKVGLDEFAALKLQELTAKKLPPKVIFFIMVDIITGAFCEKIGDINQELRVNVLLRIHKLANPRIFDSTNEYSQRIFKSNISQLILTQDDPIMREVYKQMLKRYNLDVIVVPDERFEGLRKDNPILYAKVAQYLNNRPNNIGFYDDTETNLNAANEIGMLTKLATGIKNNDPELIEKEAASLVEQLFNEQNSYGTTKQQRVRSLNGNQTLKK